MLRLSRLFRRGGAAPRRTVPEHGDHTGRSSSDGPPSFDLDAAAATDAGCVRADNQDAVLVQTRAASDEHAREVLAIVADGMGGHAGGRVASAMVVEAVSAHVRQATRDADPIGVLQAALAAANTAVHERAGGASELAGMGATVAVALVSGGACTFASVGDSRIYLLRDGDARQLSEDHTPVRELVREGWITERDAAQHPERNLVSRALGTQAHVEVDVWQLNEPLRAGDRLLLCSDGLYDGTSVERLREVAAVGPPKQAVQRLIEAARETGGADNISAIVIAAQPAHQSDCGPRTTSPGFVPAEAMERAAGSGA